ncbi:endonuclease/exonuclease/phosphatase family protein [Elusimicrobiota bacterium]
MVLKFLSYNCSALPLLTHNVSERLEKFTVEVAKYNPDIIVLQELSFTCYLEMLKKGLKDWPYVFCEPRILGAISGAIAVFSKVPFSKTAFQAYEHQGTYFGHSIVAKLSKKGLICVEFDNPKMRLIHTHLIPDYREEYSPGKYFSGILEDQMEEMLSFIEDKNQHEPNVPVVLLGDLNFPPETYLYKRLKSRFDSVDCMEKAEPPPHFSNDQFWSAPGVPLCKGRLDYVLLNPPSAWKVVSSQFVFKESFKTSSGVTTMISDHLGVLVEAELGKGKTKG